VTCAWPKTAFTVLAATALLSPPVLASGDPPPPSSARVHFDVAKPGYRLHLRPPEGTRGAKNFWLDCTAPCSLTLPTGPRRLFVSKGDRELVLAGTYQLEAADYDLRGTYYDYHTTRRAGWLLFGLGMATFVVSAMLFASSVTFCSCDNPDSSDSDCACDRREPKQWAGGIGMGVSVIPVFLGLVLAGQEDRVALVPTPRSAP